MSFLVPSVIPQDLLLIQDILGPLEHAPQKKSPKIDEDIHGSDSESENASEVEIEADLVDVKDEDAEPRAITFPVESISETDSSSDSESSDSEEEPSKPPAKDLDVEEESGAAPPTTSYFQTKNELLETDVAVPDIEEVGADETLERVGEVMSIIDKTVIVKGISSDVFSSSRDRTLDCDTLLVFEDRKVLGYIYDTFGPTSQPLYQVKFNASYPIDTDKVQPSRPVFHVPQRSKFVFVEHIKRMKGSDASNMHDEEPGDDELEFSDDEAEAAHKRRLRAESRANSVSASRGGTPALMRDQDMDFYEHNPYGDHSAYDEDFGAGPSRPAPMPYDDPYSDEYNNVPPADLEPPSLPPLPTPHSRTNSFQDGSSGRSRGRQRGLGRPEGSGRGRGRERGRGGRGWGDNNHTSRRSEERGREMSEPYGRHPQRPLSPTTMAIARATGQFPDGSDFSPHSASGTPAASWTFDPSQQFNVGYPSPFVQPHINPRFASAFGLNVYPQPQPQPYYYQPALSAGGGWNNEWTVHGNDESKNAP
ncbi:Gar1/Naf1 RNA binding region-domain-containing protein [Mycena pura]|uniref:H/ACA ribonucleoprotein complex non-core subunit NAF1 n=1 Tax=Mycena pura TaxID=153505 RepID=A0AAD6XZ00_9AGAR|nr:Gar1/Naf1 RNA binding region-domain-containing protein [Mycena pura]